MFIFGKQILHKSIFNIVWLVLIVQPLLDIEDGMDGCFENLWEEGVWGEAGFIHFVIE